MATMLPGKHCREGITLLQFADLFSTEDAAPKWLETMLWTTGERVCDGS